MEFRLFRMVLLAGAVFLLFVGFIWWNQRSMIYLPTRELLPPDPDRLAGLQEVEFPTQDGLRLGGWFVPARGARSGASFLVLNGNGGNRSYRTPLAEALSGAGHSVLLFDYRGYGGNPGSPTEAGLLADARAARRYLLSRNDAESDRLVYFGESLGAAVAITLAREHPPSALILRSPFTSLADVGRIHYPYLPVRLILADRFPSVEIIGELACPVMIVAGEADRIIPFEQSRRLFEAAPDPKRFLPIPGADHNDLVMLAGESLLQAIAEFLGEFRTTSIPDSSGVAIRKESPP